MLSQQVNTSPEAQVIVTSDTPFEDVSKVLNEMRIAMNDLEHIDEVINEAVQVSQDLIDEGAAVEQIQAQQEGVSQPALESLQRNVNSLMMQVGIEQRACFAAGAYNNNRQNKTALEAAMDDIKNILIRIRDAIVAAISKTMDFVKEIVKKYFDAAIKIKKNCGIIKAHAISLKGKSHRSTERVGGFHLAKYARYNNKAIDPSQLVANYDSWTTHNYNFISSVTGKSALGEYTAHLQKLADYFSGLGFDSRINDIKREIDSFGDLMVSRIVSNFSYHRNGVHSTPPYIGDIYYQFDESNLSFSIEQIDKYEQLGNENTHIPLTVDQVVIMCDKLIAHMKEYEKLDAYFNELDTLRKSASKIAEDAISGKSDLDFVQRKAVSMGASFVVKIFIDAIRKVGLGARQYDMQVTTAIMQWCAASISTL